MFPAVSCWCLLPKFNFIHVLCDLYSIRTWKHLRCISDKCSTWQLLRVSVRYLLHSRIYVVCSHLEEKPLLSQCLPILQTARSRCHFSKKYRTEDLPSSLLPDRAVIWKALTHTGDSKDHWLSHSCITAKTCFLRLVIKPWEIPELPCSLSLSLLNWGRCGQDACMQQYKVLDLLAAQSRLPSCDRQVLLRRLVGLDGDGRCTSISPSSRVRVLYYCNDRFFKSCSGTFWLSPLLKPPRRSHIPCRPIKQQNQPKQLPAQASLIHGSWIQSFSTEVVCIATLDEALTCKHLVLFNLRG